MGYVYNPAIRAVFDHFLSLISGNKNLLEVCEMWGYLIEHYRKKKCLVDGEHWPETDS